MSEKTASSESERAAAVEEEDSDVEEILGPIRLTHIRTEITTDAILLLLII